ncbi:hypothetical protein GN316_11180 [Xylophilus sp. Kf1]|nr:hypothetical protein [Xylophilus sp. Kf1]
MRAPYPHGPGDPDKGCVFPARTMMSAGRRAARASLVGLVRLVGLVGLVALAGLPRAALSAEPVVDIALQRALFDSYQMCATLQLPENFRQIRDPGASAATAARQCRVERLAVAGQFALDNPGTQETARYLATQQKRVALALGNWILASPNGTAPHPLTPPNR